MSKRIKVTVAVLLTVATIVILLGALINAFNFKIPEREAPDMPEYYGTPLHTLAMPSEDASEEEIKAFVVELYDLACSKYQAEEKAAFEVRYTTLIKMGGAINIPVPGSRYCVKDGDKRYYLDFTIPDEGMMGLVNLGLAPPISSHYAEAVYTDETMDYMISRKEYKESGANHNGVGPHYDDDDNIIADWSATEETELKKIDYAAYQDGQFRHTDHNVSMDTILTASVTYSKEFRFYTCQFELDPEKVPQELLDSLRENSNQPTAKYTKLVQTMTVWDSGYLRTYHAIDYWASNTLSSELDFETLYYYQNETDKVDINNYPYMAEMCHK